MERNDLKSMSLDQLWNLHEEIAAKLTDKMAHEKARLEQRLRKIEAAGNIIGSMNRRRPKQMTQA
jgi:DNA-binding protein H-NS